MKILVPKFIRDTDAFCSGLLVLRIFFLGGHNTKCIRYPWPSTLLAQSRFDAEGCNIGQNPLEICPLYISELARCVVGYLSLAQRHPRQAHFAVFSGRSVVRSGPIIILVYGVYDFRNLLYRYEAMSRGLTTRLGLPAGLPRLPPGMRHTLQTYKRGLPPGTS